MDPVAHFSVALAASGLAAPEAPVLVLGLATQVPDLLSFAFIAAGVERKAETSFSWKTGLRYETQPSISWSHSLLMTMVWSGLAAAIVGIIYRDPLSTILAGAMVLSHWVLDAVAYPNMPLAFAGSPRVGLGLITSRAGFFAGIALEVILIGGGIAIYVLGR